MMELEEILTDKFWTIHYLWII